MRRSKRKSLDANRKKIEKVYFNPKNPGSFGGKRRLLQSADLQTIPHSEINDWLQNTDSYTLYRPTRQRFLRRKTVVSGIDACWQLDLTVLDDEMAKANDGLRYVLFCIDVFSRYAWARMIYKKSASEIVAKLSEIISADSRIPKAIQTDKGKEFINSKFQAYLKARYIKHYTSENNDIKAALVERLQRTIKERLHRYMFHNGSLRFVYVLDKFMYSYNNSFHSAVNMSPAKVDRVNQEAIWNA